MEPRSCRNRIVHVTRRADEIAMFNKSMRFISSFYVTLTLILFLQFTSLIKSVAFFYVQKPPAREVWGLS
jgi:hypothetical protein